MEGSDAESRCDRDGYVGLVTGACLSERGASGRAAWSTDELKIRRLEGGRHADLRAAA